MEVARYGRCQQSSTSHLIMFGQRLYSNTATSTIAEVHSQLTPFQNHRRARGQHPNHGRLVNGPSTGFADAYINSLRRRRRCLSLFNHLLNFHLPKPPCLSYIMLFATLLAAVAVSAMPVEREAKTIAISLKHVSTVTSMKNLVSKGQTRLASINGVKAVGPSPEVSSGSITNEDETYVAPIVIGGNTWDLIVDTGCTLVLRRPSNAVLT